MIAVVLLARLLPVNTNPIPTNTLYSATPQIDTGLPFLDAVINPALAVVVALIAVFALNPQRDTMQWAKNLRVEDVEKIELISEPSAGKERYRLFTSAEFPNTVELVNESHGTYLPDPEPLSGGYTALYITTKDGVRHTFANSSNTYLVIDGESYDVGYEWLSSWESKKGNTFLPATFSIGDKPLLTIDELKTIAQKGYAISWEDFAAYVPLKQEITSTSEKKTLMNLYFIGRKPAQAKLMNYGMHFLNVHIRKIPSFISAVTAPHPGVSKISVSTPVSRSRVS